MNPKEFIKNFRDIGKSVNTIAGKQIFPEQILYRGGRLNSIFSHEEVLHIPTIINLRRAKDDKPFKCNFIHIPADNKVENYNTNDRKIRKWINLVIAKIIDEKVSLPLFIHCTSGKDRTGVITAVILKAFDIPEKIIVQEYLLSEGVNSLRDILHALKGIGDIKQYLKGNATKLLVNKILDAPIKK